VAKEAGTLNVKFGEDFEGFVALTLP